MRLIDSGSAAVLEMGLTPLALLLFGIAAGQEVWSRRALLALAIGATGLACLFGPAAVSAWIGADGGWAPVLGSAAVAWAAVAYAWGSVIVGPLVRTYGPMPVAGATTLLGGLALLAPALALEPEVLSGWTGAAWAGWLFLVLFGSVLGFSLYIRLLRDLGPFRAGAYAFVSPVIALFEGAAFLGEAISPADIAGTALLLTAAWFAMARPDTAAELKPLSSAAAVGGS